MSSPKLLQILIGILCLYLWGCTAVAQPSRLESARIKIVPPGFEQVVTQLREHTQVPLFLPTRIPNAALVATDGKPQPYLQVPLTEDGKFKGVYPYIYAESLKSDYYSISLDAEPGCRGAGACSFGLLSGQKLTPDSPSVAKEYAYQTEDPSYNPVGRSPEKAGPVSLSKGIQGYFVPFVCGASCDTSKVFWEQNGYRYMVGIRYASQKTMIDMANSAIENQKSLGK